LSSKENKWGAEAILQRDNWLEYQVLRKIRIPKTYRIEQIDNNLRRSRTISESKLLVASRDAGVKTPFIFDIDLETATITMEYIEGQLVKDLLNSSGNFEEKIYSISLMGRNVGKLHSKDIIHGDLTTSNMIKIKGKNQIAFIDFGVGYISDRIEDFGIDMYLLERAFQNTHPDLLDKAWSFVMKGYKITSPHSQSIESKIQEITSRGRYSDRV